MFDRGCHDMGLLDKCRIVGRFSLERVHNIRTIARGLFYSVILPESGVIQSNEFKYR